MAITSGGKAQTTVELLHALIRIFILHCNQNFQIFFKSTDVHFTVMLLTNYLILILTIFIDLYCANINPEKEIFICALH